MKELGHGGDGCFVALLRRRLVAGIGAIESPQPLAAAETDTLSLIVDIGLRLLGAIAIAGSILGLSGLNRLGQSIPRIGEGANIVLLFDRSASMNDTFRAGGDFALCLHRQQDDAKLGLARLELSKHVCPVASPETDDAVAITRPVLELI